MPNFCCYPLSTFFISFFAFKTTNAQAPSSVKQSASFDNARSWFQKETGGDAHLYTGKEYTGFEAKIAGDPYFAFSQMQNADLFYNGTFYQNIPLLFDAVRQEVVINSFNQEARIKLLNEKIKYFILGGHRFENISMVEGNDGNISNGIFDVAFSGAASVLIKRAKRIFKALKAEEQDSFIEADEFFIRNGKNFYPVDNRNSVIEALNDKKDLIKTYIRKNRFSFKKNFEKELIITTTYYSTLKI